jgi:hypothetical protein
MRFPATSANSNAGGSGKAQLMFSIMTWTVGIGAALSVAASLVGCNGDSSPVAPTFARSRENPRVIALSVNVGSTRGGTPIKITGTELHQRAKVTFGTATPTSSTGWDPREVTGTSLLISTPAHAAGVVDVIVTNPNGETFRLNQGYEYVPQQSFDFNGDWDGVTTDGSDALVQFTISNNVLVTASCRYDATKTVVLSTAVMNGEFSPQAPGEFSLAGRIVSATEAIGTLNAPTCVNGTSPWRASKLPR